MRTALSQRGVSPEEIEELFESLDVVSKLFTPCCRATTCACWRVVGRGVVALCCCCGREAVFGKRAKERAKEICLVRSTSASVSSTLRKFLTKMRARHAFFFKTNCLLSAHAQM